MNKDKTYLLCNEGDLKVIGSKDKNSCDMNCINSRFPITLLRVGSVVGMKCTVIFMAKGTNVHPILRDNNLVTRYIFSERYVEIPNKVAYMDD